MFFRKREPTYLEHLSEYYSLDWKFGANSLADGYRAYDKTGNSHCAIWVTREALTESDRIAFHQHMLSLSEGVIEQISRYGCDVDGIGYVALSCLATKRMDYDAPTPLVKARRLLAAILKIEALHLAGRVCGNLCDDSFMLDSDEDVHFVGYAGGAFGRPHRELPAEYRVFIPPELLDGTESSPAADVYALAVIGLRLFGAVSPDDSIQGSKVSDYVRSLDPQAPTWLRTVLPGVLSRSPTQRYKSASELLDAISAHVACEKKLAAERHDGQDTVHDQKQEHTQVISLPRGDIRRQAWRGQLTRSRLFVMSCACGVLCLALFAVCSVPNIFLSISETERAGILKSDWRAGINGEDATATSSQDTSAQPEVGSRVSTNTEATQTILTAEVSALWQERLSKGKSGGYPVTAEVLGYLVKTPSSMKPADISAILTVMDLGLSREKRRDAVLSYESVDPDLAYMLAGALTLDLADPNLFRELLMRGAKKQTGVGRAPIDSVSTLALIAAIPSARELLFEPIMQRAASMSDPDAWWLLETLILQRAEQLQKFVQSNRINQLARGYHRFFVQTIAHASDMQNTPFGALLKSARQQPDTNDVQNYSQWYDPASVKVLLATLLMSDNSEVIESSLNALSTKSTGNISVDDALSYVNNNVDVGRASYGQFVGGVGLIESLSQEEVKAAFSSIRGKPFVSHLSKLMLQRGSPLLVTAILANLGDTINPALLVDLLKHPDRSVRLLIIPYVKGVSLSSSWQQVIDSYLTESDPEVKARYESEMPRIRGS
jgi:hypothetical protein